MGIIEIGLLMFLLVFVLIAGVGFYIYNKKDEE